MLTNISSAFLICASDFSLFKLSAVGKLAKNGRSFGWQAVVGNKKTDKSIDKNKKTMILSMCE